LGRTHEFTDKLIKIDNAGEVISTLNSNLIAIVGLILIGIKLIEEERKKCK